MHYANTIKYETPIKHESNLNMISFSKFKNTK